MIRYFILSFVFAFYLFPTENAVAENCSFAYWEVIPSDSPCKEFTLPDFVFSRAEITRPEHQAVARFCKSYEVRSSYGSQLAGYCYTGEGDRIGPRFRLGDPDWSAASKVQDRIYVADLSFEGCYKGRKSKGIVFVEFGWVKAPAFISRAFPLEGIEGKCAP